MPNEHAIIGGLATFSSLLGTFSYLISVFSGKSTPHTITWGIWFLIMTIVALGQIQEGAGPGAWATGLGSVYTLLIFLISLKRGETSVSNFDWMCLVLALTATGLYCFSNTVLYSMALATFVDSLGYLPTYRKSLKAPEEEPILPWCLYIGGSALSGLAAADKNLNTLLYPVVITLMNTGLLGILVFGRRANRLALGQKEG